MRIVRVIPCRVLRQRETGRTASMYGAHPEPHNADAWEIVQQGWTWECDDGTIGLCRVAARTHEEAQEFAARYNARLGFLAP